MLNNMAGLLQALFHKARNLGIILNQQDLHDRPTPTTAAIPERTKATRVP
jgi:hypothetical protein